MGSDIPGYGTYLHMAVMRDGPVLMLLNVWEFTGQEGHGPTASRRWSDIAWSHSVPWWYRW
jgi:hypothetical protein